MKIFRRRVDTRKKDDGPIHLTADGFARLKEKLVHLQEKLPVLIEEAKRTAAFGDRSDNAEYKEAKSALRRANSQILSLNDQIKRVVVIRSGPNISGKIEIGSTVVLEVEGIKKTFEIVGSHETDPAHGRISYKSPLGAALMGCAKGDVVTIQTNSGQKTYRVVQIL